MEYVRFQSRYASAAGLHVGIFGLVNVLGRHGMLTPGEEQFRRESNDWYDSAYPDPGVAAGVYGDQANARAAAWFKSTSIELIARVTGYLAILDAHAIAWHELRTTDPGTIIYEDAHQVVALPRQPGQPR
jgi:hypothetical protein